MRFLLTSNGISNISINDALVDLLGKPISEASALCIPTGTHPFRDGAEGVYRFISGTAPSPMCGLGWKSLGVLELTALPTIDQEHWTAAVQETDALLVWGGNTFYLCYWMRKSGLAALFPALRRETVYVGVSAGSMVVTPDFGEPYDGRNPTAGSDDGLGLVDFSLAPHLDHEGFPNHSLANLENWGAGIAGPAYAIDDQTAIKVVDDTVEVVSEGHRELFPSRSESLGPKSRPERDREPRVGFRRGGGRSRNERRRRAGD